MLRNANHEPTTTNYELLVRHLLRRSAGRAFEGPASDVTDLFLHCSRERDDSYRYLHEILFRYLSVFEPSLRYRGYHTLLDLGSGPALRELGQLP